MTGRLHAIAFALLCLAGAVAAIGLTVHEALRTPPVAVGVAATSRNGLTTTVEVSVRNTTGHARCTAIRVAARDREGHDLAAVTAVGALRLPPHAREQVTARLRLTERQYAEQLYRFYPAAESCASPGKAS